MSETLREDERHRERVRESVTRKDETDKLIKETEMYNENERKSTNVCKEEKSREVNYVQVCVRRRNLESLCGYNRAGPSWLL